MWIPQADPKASYLAHQAEIDAAIQHVLLSGQYILGVESLAFEQEFAAYIGQPYAVGVANGTDALYLALRACEVDQTSEVITVAHTAIATIAAIHMTGATPVCVDIDPNTYTLNIDQLEAALTPRTKVILPVHLYGQPADLQPILEIANHHHLWVIEDCAQAHGSHYHGERVGAWGQLAAFSFYPTKNLGALGDGGLVVCRDERLYAKLTALRQYGWDADRISQIAGINSRLDEIQAAILRVKLRFLDTDNAQRRATAALYTDMLHDTRLHLPTEMQDTQHVYHQYVIRHSARDALRAYLAERGIGTAIHYAIPANLHPGYRDYIRCSKSLDHTEQAAQSILSLPMYPELSETQVEYVARTVREWASAKN